MNNATYIARRVLALPVIRPASFRADSGAPFPQTPNPFSSLQEARNESTSIVDSESFGASLYPLTPSAVDVLDLASMLLQCFLLTMATYRTAETFLFLKYLVFMPGKSF